MSSSSTATSPSAARRLRGIKLIVIALGLVIVVGFVVVIVTIVGRLAAPKGDAALGTIAVAVPAGCALADAWSDDGKFFLRLAGDPTCPALLVVDQASGELLGTVTLTPTP
jgi:hypothetical protein